MKKYSTIIIVCAVVIALTILAIQFVFPSLKRQSTTLPLSPKAQQQSSPKRIIGFLPYWQISTIDTSAFSPLTEVIYFGVHIDEKGALLKKDEDGNSDLGMAKLKGQAFKTLTTGLKRNNANLSVAIILQDNEKIEIFLKETTARKHLIQETADIVGQYELSGINLDFEYSGIPARETIAQYADFVKEFSESLKEQYPALVVSVDVTADAIKKSRLYDVEKLAQSADYLILMGYDFYRPSSSVAGPVAPLTGKEMYDYDVTSAVFDFLTVTPKEKLVLGVPYYGWDFPTLDDSQGSMVEKRQDEAVALASYKRVKQLIAEKGLEVRYDGESQTPWLIYKDPNTGGTRQIWFEDETSLGKKYDLVNKQNLAGIAIWALGYDGTHDELWKLLEEKFRR